MIELGKRQKLNIVKEVEFGVYLSEENQSTEEERVLLPKKQVPAGATIGTQLEVFIYKDSKDRLIATTNHPKLMLHEVGFLKVAQVGTIGAFLDWGLEKEILLPYKEQTKKVNEGETHLVAIYIDKSKRLCATMNVYEYLDTDSPYEKEDRVTGIVYQISKEFGAFVAVDNRFSGLIPQKEMYGTISIGDVVTARVTERKPDGKLDLSIREKAYLQIEKDAAKILHIMENRGGKLPFTDKADPELIKDELQMSKNEFKRAVGNLLKNGVIAIEADSIQQIKK